MKRETAKWVRKAEDDIQAARRLATANPPLKSPVCFHCQQWAEKYLKALLQNQGDAVPKTHDLEIVLDLLLPRDSTLGVLRRRLLALTRYAVDYRYPDETATTREMRAALHSAERVRLEVRTRLGLTD